MKRGLSRNRQVSPGVRLLSVFISAQMMFSPLAGLGANLPSGGSIAHGDASWSTAGQAMQIQQQSQKAIINWDDFSIGAGYGVYITQPSAAAAMLSRVIGTDPSSILGKLQANGIFYLVNPNGVYFGKGAQVDVAQLIASTLNITDENFLGGNLVFEGLSEASVENLGLINAQMAALIARNVKNIGDITSKQAILAAASKVDLGRIGSGTLSVDLTGLMGDAINEGTIDVSGETGGQVVMKGDRVGMFGGIRADGEIGDGGDITLDGLKVVAIGPEGLITANAGESGDGGTITAFSPDTALFRAGARLEAKGGQFGGDGGFIEVSG